MTKTDRDMLAQVQQHVNEAEVRVARQKRIVEELERDHHLNAAVAARRLLRTMEDTLQVAREHLRLELEKGRFQP